jgi:hypothetical protein
LEITSPHEGAPEAPESELAGGIGREQRQSVCGRASAAVREPVCECRWLHGLDTAGWCGATRPSPDPPRAAGRVASADQGRQVRASGEWQPSVESQGLLCWLCWAHVNQPGQPPLRSLPALCTGLLHSTALADVYSAPPRVDTAMAVVPDQLSNLASKSRLA